MENLRDITYICFNAGLLVCNSYNMNCTTETIKASNFNKYVAKYIVSQIITIRFFTEEISCVPLFSDSF